MPLPPELDIPVLEWSTLPDAIRWVAFDEQPIPADFRAAFQDGDAPQCGCGDDEADPARLQRDARRALFISLRKGQLKAFGRISTATTTPNCDWNARQYVNHSRSRTEIPAHLWTYQGIDWQESGLKCQDCEYIKVRLRTSDLFEAFPASREAQAGPSDAPARPQPESSSYRSPYIDLMLHAIAELRVTVQNQPLKDVLVDWFKGQNLGGKSIPDYLARAMATLVRLPETQRGGNRKWTFRD